MSLSLLFFFIFLVLFIASLWAKYKYPVPFDRVFFAHGKNVQVIVREVAGEHEGKG